MVKYGGVTEAQALAMITINPARELGLEDRLGSIEVGKDADIALFNAHPFDAFARCELALIDGEVWFQRARAGGQARGPARRPRGHARPRPRRRGAELEIAADPEGIYALVGGDAAPGQRPRHRRRHAGRRATARSPRSAGPRRRVPAAAQTIDVQGLDVWPGLIDAGSPSACSRSAA